MLKFRRICSVLLLSIVVAPSCTDEESARSALETQGFTDVTLHGYSLGCSDSDDTCTKFSAIVPATGKLIKGSVGCGYNTGCSKGCTIRFDAK